MIPLKSLGAWSKICLFIAFQKPRSTDGRTVMEAKEQTLVTVSHQTLCKSPVEMCTWISFHRLQQIQEFHFQLKYKEQTMDTCPDCSMFSTDLLTVHKYCTITVIFKYKERELYAQEDNSGQLWGFSSVFHILQKKQALSKGAASSHPDFLPFSLRHVLTLNFAMHSLARFPLPAKFLCKHG